MNQNIVVYGTGQWGTLVCNKIVRDGETLAAVIDSNPEKWGTLFCGMRIMSPLFFENYSGEQIFIAIANESESEKIIGKLKSNGIDENNIWDLTRIKREFLSDFPTNQVILSDRKPQVLFDCMAGLGLGGVEEWTKRITASLEQCSLEVKILTRDGDYLLDEKTRQRTIFVKQSKGNPYEEKNLIELYKVISGMMPCVLVTSDINSLFIVAQVLKKDYPEKIHIISVVHSGIIQLYYRYGRYQDLVDKYIVVSHEIEAGMICAGICKKKIVFSDFFIDTDETLVRKYSDISKPIQIAYAGRLTISLKRLDLIIKLMEELEKRDVRYEFKIAGDGDYVQNILQYIREKGLQTKVNVIGRIKHEEMRNFWKSADIAVNISDVEGICLSNLEAMAEGCVPIITQTSAKEYIIDGENGFLVPIGDYRRMAEIIKYIEDNRSLLDKMGWKAYQTIHINCTKDREMRVWKRVIGGIYNEFTFVGYNSDI